MRRFSLLALSVLIPVAVSAVTIQPGSLYTDVRPGSPEEAGINVLTREGIVQGIGDGYFGPAREVNRAEFLKMAVLATPENLRPDVSPRNCFPDVRESDWFSGTICGAKDIGIVRGNADPTKPEAEWLFAPATSVTYDAALKMLTLLFGYEIRAEQAGEDWGQRYYEAARAKDTDLPMVITFDTPLTRAMSARLVAAFLAESDGQLVELRQAESGQFASSSTSASSESSASSQSSSSVSSPSSSSSASSGLYSLPAKSHFLLVGAVSKPIAGGVVSPFNENTDLVAVQAKLFQEARALEAMELTTADGTVLARLLPRTTTDIGDWKQTYDAALTGEQVHALTKGEGLTVFLRAVVRTKENDGFSDNLVHVRQILLTFKGKETTQTYSIPFTGPFPKHQTSLGHLHSVRRVSPETGALTTGNDVIVGAFEMTGTTPNGQPVALTQVVFSYDRVGTKSQLSGWTLSRDDNGAEVPCSINDPAKTISCANLKTIFGDHMTPSVTVTLRADISVEPGTHGEWFQVSLPTPGSPEELGSVWWSDQAATFRWLEGAAPVANGTLLSN